MQELSDACEWLDNWERYIQTLLEPKRKQFLSRQTCQGLRITLKSVLELTNILLTEGFDYVLTGKFCQDPLEVNTYSTSDTTTKYLSKPLQLKITVTALTVTF